MEAEQEPIQYSALQLFLYGGPVDALSILLLIGIVSVILLRCLAFRTATEPFDSKDVLWVCFFLINTCLSFLSLGIEAIGVFTAKGIDAGAGNQFALDQARFFLNIHVLAFLSILAAFVLRTIRSRTAGGGLREDMEGRRVGELSDPIDLGTWTGVCLQDCPPSFLQYD